MTTNIGQPKSQLEARARVLCFFPLGVQKCAALMLRSMFCGILNHPFNESHERSSMREPYFSFFSFHPAYFVPFSDSGGAYVDVESPQVRMFKDSCAW